MEICRIYLSGSMANLSFEEYSKWRKQIIDAIKFGDYDYDKKPIFFNPVDFYNYKEINHKTEREVMEYELYNLRKSDLIIVNLNNPDSIGTAMELVIAKENKIPVVAFNAYGKEVHPWLLECCTRVCDNLREAVEYTVDFFLN